MRMKRAKIGAEVYNKVNGEEYLITAIGREIAYADRILEREPEIEVDRTDRVLICEKNALCFRVIKDVPDTEIPSGYSIEDGILLKDGEPVTEQGELIIKKILYSFPGKLLLTVAEQGGYVVPTVYEPERDRFVSIWNSIPEPETIEMEKGVVILKYSLIHDEEDEGGNTVKIFDEAGLLYIKDGKVETIKEVCVPLGRVAAKTRNFVIIESDYMPSGSNTKVLEKKAATFVFDLTYGSEARSLPVNGVKSAADCPVYNGCGIKTDDTFVLLKGGHSGISFKFSDRKVLDKLEGYDILVDITNKENKKILTFANAEYDTISVSVKETHDRGKVVKILE